MPEPAPTLAARGALHGLTLPKRDGLAAVADAGLSARFSYRGDPRFVDDAFGVTLPTEPCRARAAGGLAALWLGPDEWLLLAPIAKHAECTRALRQATAGRPASLVDISHRNCAVMVEGEGAARLLNAGCPLDLDLAAFPVGMCARTLFAKAEVVLWRTAANTFRAELWRSFAPYVVEHLAVAIVDID